MAVINKKRWCGMHCKDRHIFCILRSGPWQKSPIFGSIVNNFDKIALPILFECIGSFTHISANQQCCQLCDKNLSITAYYIQFFITLCFCKIWVEKSTKHWTVYSYNVIKGRLFATVYHGQDES